MTVCISALRYIRETHTEYLSRRSATYSLSLARDFRIPERAASSRTPSNRIIKDAYSRTRFMLFPSAARDVDLHSS